MVGKKNIRDYEVSIWTLQDSFITVLKQSNLENREKIQEPKMTLKDDGEYTFSFKIPMYLQEDSDLTEKPYFKRERIWKENPIWYTVHNGNLMVNLRKVKVIFNKKSPDEEVFEFIINKITERHEGYSKICEVDCDGLAFHELGKQGYEIELSGDIYDAEYQEWDKSEDSNKGEAPVNNINYWIEKVLENSNWGYIINMDWSIYDGIVEEIYNGNIIDNKKYLNMADEDREQFNNIRENNGLRRKDTVYKSPYVASWQIEENKIFADTIIDDLSELEERKTVEGRESNRYNLLQTIAETFQVFCKFKYEYDDNYHIIGRKVIFYNNFINESEGIIDFNYSYNTDEITREMESSDLVTKMYIKSLKDIGTLSGEISIRDSEANPSYEDFILNFDYLYQIGTISQEQYDEIKVFQTELRKINIDINNKNAEILNYENQKSEAEIKESYAKELEDEANARVTEAGDFFKAIAGDNPNIGRTATNPLMLLVIHNSKKPGGAYSTLTQEYGDLYTSTFALYKKVDENGAVIAGSKINSSDIHFEKDSDGFIKTITYPKEETEGYVYATFQYNPNTPAEKIKKIWSIKKAQAELDEEEAQQALTDIDKALNGDDETNPPTIGLYKEVEQKYDERRELIAKFEKIMGPALREGNWQPEDEYADNVKNCVLSLGEFPFSNADSNDKANFIWDNQIMPNSEEQKLTYSEGINDIKYYPCVLLTNAEWTALHNAENVNYIYRDIYLSEYNSEHPMADEKVNHYLAIGSTNGCDFAFLRDKNNQKITPALILLGAENILDAEISGQDKPVPVFEQLQQNARIVSITTNENTGNITEGSNLVNLSNDKLISPEVVKERYELVYPRVKILSKNYLVNLPDSKIYKDNEPLYINESYYDLYHNNYNYITLKNIDLNKNYSCHYAFTTAPDAVYLDGIKILKENSVPKTSYTIKPIAIDNSIVGTAYNSIGQLAHINDHELKFENVQGYISEVELDLDKPWEDSYTIKNYKTKFEDLFSTIVAQTESMKKNSQIFSMVSNAFDANGYLTTEMVDNIQNRLSIPTSNVYVPSPAEIYGQYASAIRQQLKDAFDEAGEVLVAAQNSVEDVNNLNITNAAILGSFIENIKENMTPTTFNGASRDKQAFKIGDIWNKEGNVYVATENSSQLYPNSYPSDILTSLKGWSLVKDGSLAQIKGAKIDANAESGAIAIEAGSSIDIRSGGSIAIAANSDLSVTANNIVNITGSQINIGSVNSSDNKGIKIVSSTASSANSASSFVDIKPSGINMATAGGITMKGAGGINIYTSDSSNTSAIKLDRNTGIYLGSTQPITFYSGQVNATGSVASALISKDRILFGVSDGSTGTAVDLTKDYIVFGSNFATNNYINAEPTQTGPNIGENTSGVKITKDAIKMASGSETNRSYFNLDKDKLEFGVADNASNGGFIQLTKAGKVTIGVGNDSIITTNTTTGFKTVDINKTTARFEVYAPNFIVDSEGKLYANNAYISGTIYSGAGQIGGWDINENFLTSTTTRDGKTYITGLQKQSFGTWAIAVAATNMSDWSTAPFRVQHNGALWATSAHIEGEVAATSGSFGDGSNKIKIGSNATHSWIYSGNKTEFKGASNGFFIGTEGISLGIYNSTSEHSPFEVNTSGVLYATGATISGSITATSGSIANWTIGSIHIGNASVREDSTVAMSYNKDWTLPANKDSMVFWAGGNPNNTGNHTLAPFRVTYSGKLYAKDAVIEGEITATSLKINSKDVTNIDSYIDGRINNNTNVLNAGSDKAKVFYSTPTVPYKKGDIWVGGSTGEIKYCKTNKTSTQSYSADDWILASKYTDDSVANGKAKVFTDATPPTTGMKTGDIWVASGGNTSYPAGKTYRYVNSTDKWVVISAGAITGTKLDVDATAGTIELKAKNTITISSGKDLEISGNGKLALVGSAGITIASGCTFTVASNNFNIDSSGNVTMSGKVTATSGSIGGWTIGLTNKSYFMCNNTSLANSTIGLYPYTSETSTDDEYPVIWAGGKRVIQNTTGGNTNSELAPFMVYRNGKLISSNIEIMGGSLNINNGKFQVSSAGVLQATGAIISGTLNAGAGSSIGGWTIGSSYIGNADSIENSSVGLNAGAGTNNPVLWIGGARLESNKDSTNTNLDHLAPFRVTRAGKLYANGATISGKARFTLNASTNKNYCIVIANDEDTALFRDQLSDADDKTDILWIKPTTTTNGISISKDGKNISYQICNCSFKYYKCVT